ncbi:MAG: HAMP domain-containing protein [Proteobacteria bacterium]|nr:HAMP domain-containing protein [Pseudomonadota bacterium]
MKRSVNAIEISLKISYPDVMTFKLSHKLFAAFFLILAIVAGTLVLSRVIFSLHFKNYIQQLDREKLESLAPVLGNAYKTHGNWNEIKSNPWAWQQIMNMPPNGGAFRFTPSSEGGHPEDRLRPTDGRPHGRPHDVFLVDAMHRPVMGEPGAEDSKTLVSIEVDGRIVGWLGMSRKDPFRSGRPEVFMEQQARQFYILGSIVIGLTGLIAFIFSRSLLKPIGQLTLGTRELANRNFSVRIPPATGDELGQLADHFNTMARTLENYEKTRRQWLTDISHELRTPLGILRGEIEALQDGIREPSSENLSSLHAEILRITKLVEDLHLISMAESDSLFFKKEPVCPAFVLEKTGVLWEQRLGSAEIQTQWHLDSIKNTLIKGDADRLGQVFSNIFENTCKYVGSPGMLKITGLQNGNLIKLLFEDSGPGVPEEALSRLFDRLYRVENSRNRGSGGSGLGLSICRHILENHKGKIWAQSNDMGGLSIGIHLPLA